MKNSAIEIGVIGDGGWGTTLALVLASKGIRVSVWGAFPDYVEEVRRKRENVKFLPGFRIPESIYWTSDLKRVCLDSNLLVLAVPSQHVRSVLTKIDRKLAHQRQWVNVAKGIETHTLKTMSQVIHEELGPVGLCVLSGPTIAKEIAQGMPAAASVASSNEKLRSQVRKVFMTDSFSLFESQDVLGVELGGSIKNVIAISAGIVEGLGFGSNTRAALFARGVAEMARLGLKMGARRETFMGLSGLGDLATTCLSPLSRNRWLGEEIGKGRRLKNVLKETPMVVEGVETSKAVVGLAKKFKVAMPICEAVYSILFHSKEPRTAVTALLHRELSSELD